MPGELASQGWTSRWEVILHGEGQAVDEEESPPKVPIDGAKKWAKNGKIGPKMG